MAGTKGSSDASIHIGVFSQSASRDCRFLNERGGEVLSRTDGAIVTRDSCTGQVIALAYDYPPEEIISLPVTGSLALADALDASDSSRDLSIRLRGLSPNTP